MRVLSRPHTRSPPQAISQVSLSLSFTPLHLRRGRTLRHLVFTFYTSVWATHSPNRSPSHKPSLATDHTIANIYQVVKNGLSLHACASTCTFITFPCFCSFFEVSLPLGRNRKNTRDLDSCFSATTWQLGLLKHWKRLRATPPNQSRASQMIFAHRRFPAGSLTI